MRRITLAALLLLASLGSIAPGGALAQDAGAADDDGVQIDPATGERWRWVRPDEQMRRGLLPVGAWVAVAGGSLVAVGAVVALVLRARTARRRRP